MLNYQNQLLTDDEMLANGFYYVQSSVNPSHGNWHHEDCGLRYSTFKSMWTLNLKQIFPKNKEQILNFLDLFKE